MSAVRDCLLMEKNYLVVKKLQLEKSNPFWRKDVDSTENLCLFCVIMRFEIFNLRHGFKILYIEQSCNFQQ